jgi:hypothetical protein
MRSVEAAVSSGERVLKLNIDKDAPAVQISEDGVLG